MKISWVRRIIPAMLGITALTLELAFPSHRKTVQMALLIGAVLWAISRVPIYMEMTRGMIIGIITATALCGTGLAFIWRLLPMDIVALAFVSVPVVIVFAFIAAKVAELIGGAVEKPSLKL